MIQNKSLFKLSKIHMAEIHSLAEKKGTVRYLDPRDYVGFDVFREDVDEPAKDAI